jgi:two-component system, cell cycle response regulator
VPQRARILVIDDTPANVRLLKARLTGLGYRVEGATEAHEGLRLALASPPDLVITDVMMPGMDGFELTRRLKVDPSTRLVPVILATALESTEARLQGLECGADEFLSKPVDATVLELRVRSLVRVGQLRAEMAHRRALLAKTHAPRPAPDVEEERVLLVDDDPLFSRQFVAAADVAVDVAGNLLEARERLAQRSYSAYFVDLNLPDGSGNALLAEIRSNPELSLRPVLVVSAQGDLETKLAALECGAEDYLIKPVPRAELAARVAACLRRSRTAQEQEVRLKEALEASVTDPGTGLHNRRYLFDDLGNRLRDAAPGRAGFGLLLCDLDHFKSVNDELGHVVGDRLLREFSSLLRGALRLSDLAARYGGEEFVAVLPNADEEVALRTAERLRALIEGHEFGAAPGRRVTVSIGVTVLMPSDGRAEDVLDRADQAAYAAKAAGRNAVRLNLLQSSA